MKITKYLTLLAAAVGMTAACQQEEMVVFNPENVVAPVLHAVEDIVVTVDNKSENVTFSWDAADFGVKSQVYYSLDMSKDGKSVNLFTGVSGNSMNVSYDNINNKAFNDLNIPSGEAGEVVFTLSARLNAGASYAAAPVTAKVTPTAAEKVYPKVWVIGNYCGWAHDKSLFLWNFDEDDDKFMGIVDFGAGDEKTGGFKLTPEGNWNAEFGGTGTADEDPASIPVVTSGGSDIKNFTAKRYYHFTLSKSALTLTKNFSFDQVGIIGLNGDWDNDIVMEYSVNKQRFYADIDVPAATEMKFRMDADWGVNFGGDIKAMTNGGGNIPVEPGQYRVYFDMNNLGAITCTFDTKMYGQEESTGSTEEPAPEPEPVKGWGIIGAFNGWGGDLAMTAEGNYYVVKGAALEGELKFRKDADWGVNFGYAEGATFEANAEIALAQDGGNIVVAAGTYDVYLDEANAKAWFINDGSYPGGGAAPVAAEWGLIGSLAACNNWGNNVVLYVEGDYSVAKNVAFAAGDQFKFRKGEAWGVELTYEGQISIDARLDLIDGTGGKQNSSIAEGGNFDVYLANDLSCFYVMTPGKTPADAGEAQKVYTDPSAESFVVGFSGSVLGWDDPAFETNDRAAFVSKNVTDETTFAGTYEFKLEGLSVAAGDEFKVRINGQWIGVGGATVEGLAVSGTDNFIADQAGTYTAVITFAWDGGNYSDVKVVFTSEATELPTPDAKQWTFNWTAMGMGDMAGVLDFGVAIPGQCVVAYDPAVMGAPEGTPYQIFNMIGYRFEAVDATSGKLTLISTNMYGDEITQEFTYSNLTETSCYFTFGEDSFIAQDADATLTEVAIDTTGGVM